MTVNRRAAARDAFIAAPALKKITRGVRKGR
jgi:hypothetical protein